MVDRILCGRCKHLKEFSTGSNACPIAYYCDFDEDCTWSERNNRWGERSGNTRMFNKLDGSCGMAEPAIGEETEKFRKGLDERGIKYEVGLHWSDDIIETDIDLAYGRLKVNQNRQNGHRSKLMVTLRANGLSADSVLRIVDTLKGLNS